MKALSFYDKGTIRRDIDDLHRRFPDAGRRKIAWYYVKELVGLHQKATPSLRDNPTTRGFFTGLAKNSIRNLLAKEYAEKPNEEFAKHAPALRQEPAKKTVKEKLLFVFFGKGGKSEGLAAD